MKKAKKRQQERNLYLHQKQELSFLVSYDEGEAINISGKEYTRQQLYFNYAERIDIEPPQFKFPKGLFQLTLTDLINGDGSSEISIASQEKIAKRISKGEYKHSMTDKGVRFEHTTIGAAQQKGENYHFVRESDEIISIHAIGSHKTSDSYCISNWSPAFEESAKA